MIFVACLFPFYILAATLTNSAAILTDLLATSFDLTALTACWLVLRLAHNANSGKYAYGLGKLENLAELMIAVLQCILVVIAGSRAISRILYPEAVSGAAFGLVVTAAAVIGNLILNRKAMRMSREMRSPVLAAQARVQTWFRPSQAPRYSWSPSSPRCSTAFPGSPIWTRPPPSW